MWWVIGIIAVLSLVALLVYRVAEKTIKASATRRAQLDMVGL